MHPFANRIGRTGAVPARFLMIVLAATSVGGCSSFSGMPEPVLRARDTVLLPDKYRPAEAVRRFYSPSAADRNQMSPEQWRNSMMAVRMAAADARYHEFRMRLGREMRGANLGLETVALGLSSAASVSSEGVANAFAAAVAALTGARASLSRELYFERTLPALVAGMEVSRLEIATTILAGLSRPVTEYPIEQAMLDALSYERAASLDQAIQRVTVEAAGEEVRQRQIYNNVQRRVRLVDETALPLINLIRSNVNRLVNQAGSGDEQARAAIGKIMSRLQLPASTDHQADAISALIAIANQTEAQRQVFVEAMRAEQIILDQPVQQGQ